LVHIDFDEQEEYGRHRPNIKLGLRDTGCEEGTESELCPCQTSVLAVLNLRVLQLHCTLFYPANACVNSVVASLKCNKRPPTTKKKKLSL
jgi:hypothetical protein